jgi:hypothetical protein
MIKHIVFIRLKDVYSSSEKIDIIKEIELRLNELPQYINEIIKLETGINFNVKASAFDLSLSVDFDTKDDLQKYQVHPKHKEVLSYLGSLDIEVAVVDYII